MKSNHAISAILAAVTLLAFSIPVPAFSQMMETGHMNKMGDMIGMCIEHADKIGLTDEQIMKMKPVHSEMQKKQARYKADVKIAEIELIDIMEVKDFDMEKAGSTVKKLAQITTDHHLDMLKIMKEVRSILTDEQFIKMKMMAMPMKTGEKKPMNKKMNKHP